MASTDLPQHIAFILDGNRRWARAQGLPTLEGHMRGMKNVENIVDWCIETDIKYLTVYAFSTENWSRAQEELAYLFNIVFPEAFSGALGRLKEKNVRIQVFGELDKFPDKMREGMEKLVADTQSNTGLVFNICLNYSGRFELTRAVKQIILDGMDAQDIDEQVIANYLFSAGMPDPDLMIRTGGEHRVSNFLLWQLAYTELYFPSAFLPGFTRADFDEALQWYASRDRRYGK